MECIGNVYELFQFRSLYPAFDNTHMVNAVINCVGELLLRHASILASCLYALTKQSLIHIILSL